MPGRKSEHRLVMDDNFQSWRGMVASVPEEFRLDAFGQ